MGVENGDGAGLGGGHGKNGFADGLSGGDGGESVAGSHDIADGEEQGAADGAAGVALGIVFELEAAGVEKDHGDGVAEGEGGGGAGGRGHVEGAGFFGDGDVESEGAVLGEGAVGFGGEGDDGDVAAFDGGEEGGDFVGGAGVTHGEEEVVVVEDAEVAVHGFDGVHDGGGGAGAVEGSGDFVANVEVFADAGDDDFAVAFDGFEAGLNGVVEGVVELFDDGGDTV